MPKKQTETLSKRQFRKEELRKKERRQQWIVIGVIAAVAIIFGAVVLISTQTIASNAIGGPIKKITPVAYNNANGAAIGNPNAKVKIDVFEDFQCVHCQDYTLNVEPQVIQQLVDTGQVYYVFHENPFLDDPNLPVAEQSSHQAALASQCAAEQNDFWNYKTLIFTNYGESPGIYNIARLEAFAKSLNLNTAQFNQCLADAKYQTKIDDDLNLGVKMGVKGTPSIFVNGVSALPEFQDILNAVQKAQQGG